MTTTTKPQVSHERMAQLGLEKDPMGYVDGMNKYQAMGDNPINRVDPTGLFKQLGADISGTWTVKEYASEQLQAESRLNPDRKKDMINNGRGGFVVQFTPDTKTKKCAFAQDDIVIGQFIAPRGSPFAWDIQVDGDWKDKSTNKPFPLDPAVLPNYAKLVMPDHTYVMDPEHGSGTPGPFPLSYFDSPDWDKFTTKTFTIVVAAYSKKTHMFLGCATFFYASKDATTAGGCSFPATWTHVGDSWTTPSVAATPDVNEGEKNWKK